MYLKSIEVHGFKSFANKILFEFKDGITGIVGPNGSGKSNVADAVRWVLGEQSAKQLRGARMEDVIFSGTEARKPVGFAYVAITLDNSDHKLPIDYEEVTVARRVYRSGESEYLINGSSCRLKDVQELFLDTGIGKEGYSIIGQGQIDKIVSGKPEDRRELFDEAAGIVKFKKRKSTAEKNLELEKQNLCRINDILTEIEKQVVPLEKQSIVAKEYLKNKEELKTIDVNIFLLEYDDIKEAEIQLEEKLKIANSDLDNTKQNYESTKEEYERLEQKIEEFNQELEQYKNRLNETNLNKEKFEGEVKVLKEQIIAIKRSDEHYKSRVEAINKDIQVKKEEQEKYLIKKHEVDDKLKALSDRKLQVDKELREIISNIENYSKKVEECNSEIFEILSENSGIKTNLQRYEVMLEQNNIKKVELNQKLLKSKSDEALQDNYIQEHKEKLLQITEQITNISKENDELELCISQIQTKITELSSLVNRKQQDFHREKSRLESLKNMTERYDGYGNSIRKIMEQKERNNGIIGVVADIITVKKQYEIAIEIALGGSIQNIVTDNANTAKDLIEFLKKNKYGRATFLPLTSIVNKNTFYNDKALSEPGVIGLASSLVDTDSRFQGLIEFLLGRIVVVDHITNAINLSKKYNYSLRIVTTEGELLSPGGSMSGGAFKNTSNLLSRRRELDELEKNITNLEIEVKKILEEIELEKNHKTEKKTVIESNKTKIQELYLHQNTIKMNLKQATSKKEENISLFTEINHECKEIDLQSRDLKAKIEEITQFLKTNEDKSKLTEQKIEELNKCLEQERQVEKQMNDKVSSLKIDFSSFEQNNQFILENIKRINKELLKLEEELKNLQESILDASNQVQVKEEMIVRTRSNISEYQNESQTLEKTINELHISKEELSKTHKEFFTKREELSARMNELDKECYRIINHKEKLSEQSDAKMNYMWEEYELTYNHARTLQDPSLNNLSQMKKKAIELKNKIKELGDVNVNAIEDYKALITRFDLLKTQRDDLIEAEEALQKIIQELDNEMRKQFEEKFYEIKKQFDIVFKELFGGGKGTLELVEDSDILEAGIKIIAQPPGKKLQNMMQLSGGEKALTAISLLFAIQNLKPSPFCLLDEIEAALDDSNVKRYAKYLHKLTKDTQFIIITHRRGTMAAADVLYGITMQEKGVSTLVSVNLIENELDK